MKENNKENLKNNCNENNFEENKIIKERRLKLAQIREKHQDAYPNNYKPSDYSADLVSKFSNYDRESLEKIDRKVIIAGRVMLKRIQGKTSFFSLKDSSGKIQLYLNKDLLGDDLYSEIKTHDLGDHLFVRGSLFKTMKGELSIKCSYVHLLAKSLRPLPDKFHGLQDQELRFRNRHLDLIINNETKEIFLKRSKILSKIRNYMERNKFLEVETPMLHPIPGGATAKPFATMHNSLNQQMYLRIAPELYLKRLIVGGFDRVFELNKSFRNEGISTKHNPEFTMLEFYVAYADYLWLMDYTEKIIKSVACDVLGKNKILWRDKVVDIEKSFERLSISESIIKYVDGINKENLSDKELLIDKLILSNKKNSREDLIKNSIEIVQYKFFEEFVEDKLVDPTFIINHPIEISPLAKVSTKNNNIAERFELYICGRELANGFSELNDPEDQAKRFLSQVKAKESGDEEAMHYDADYVEVLECGMPPTAGCGIGIDRLVMLLTNLSSIREVIFFPALKRKD